MLPHFYNPYVFNTIRLYNEQFWVLLFVIVSKTDCFKECKLPFQRVVTVTLTWQCCLCLKQAGGDLQVSVWPYFASVSKETENHLHSDSLTKPQTVKSLFILKSYNFITKRLKPLVCAIQHGLPPPRPQKCNDVGLLSEIQTPKCKQKNEA